MCSKIPHLALYVAQEIELLVIVQELVLTQIVGEVLQKCCCTVVYKLNAMAFTNHPMAAEEASQIGLF